MKDTKACFELRAGRVLMLWSRFIWQRIVLSFSIRNPVSRKALGLVLFACSLILVGCGKQKETANPTGVWQWSEQFPGRTFDYTLKLKLVAGKLTGTISVSGETVPIQDTQSKGDEISFKVITLQSRAFYVGKVAGDTLHGQISVSFENGQPRTTTWAAKRTKVEPRSVKKQFPINSITLRSKVLRRLGT